MSDVDPALAVTQEAAAAPSTEETILSGRGVRKSFAVGDRSLEILHGVNLDLRRGERLGLMGASGAGKSTLMHILGLLERPDEGRVLLDGVDAWSCSALERARVRNSKIGFVFQFYHLLPELDALENVLLPAMIAPGWRARAAEMKERARGLLDTCGLTSRVGHRPGQLSGGEQQRVAIARALLLDPPVIIADEPTGNLDSATGVRVLELLFEQQVDRGLSLLLVTHDERVAQRCERVVYMADGQIMADSETPIPE